MDLELDALNLPRSAHDRKSDARAPARTLRGRDSLLVGVGAFMASILAWIYFHHLGVTLADRDAISHMGIARRVLDSPTPGLAQLGGVWLPLPHLLFLPFIWSNALYYSGLAGSLVSMAAYITTSVLLYKIVFDLTGRRVSALAGSLVFMASPGVLYLQSTPMTELPMYACMAGIVYGLQRWMQSDDYRVLLATGVVALLGTLTRYEIWVILAAITPLLAFAAWHKGYDRVGVEGITLAFLFVGALGIAAWLAWNQLIFGNALSWEDGKYAKPSLWISNEDVAVGHWLTAVKTYWYAVVDNLGATTVLVTAAGLLLLLARQRLGAQALPALSLLVLFPFFVLSLESGQRPLHVLQINNNLYNVRFGLVMILPVAIVAGLLAGAPRRESATLLLSLGLVAIVAAHTMSSFARPETRIAVLEEPLRWHPSGWSAEEAAAVFLHRNYTGGRILAQFFDNENLLFSARIPLRENVYEGSNKQWLPALADPFANDIEWIVMRYGDGSDQVAHALEHSPALKLYKLVYGNSRYRIYEQL
jgi:Dolichyl-phosphate-mannose-protein mannosyltransferase